MVKTALITLLLALPLIAQQLPNNPNRVKGFINPEGVFHPEYLPKQEIKLKRLTNTVNVYSRDPSDGEGGGIRDGIYTYEANVKDTPGSGAMTITMEPKLEFGNRLHFAVTNLQKELKAWPRDVALHIDCGQSKSFYADTTAVVLLIRSLIEGRELAKDAVVPNFIQSFPDQDLDVTYSDTNDALPLALISEKGFNKVVYSHKYSGALFDHIILYGWDHVHKVQIYGVTSIEDALAKLDTNYEPFEKEIAERFSKVPGVLAEQGMQMVNNKFVKERIDEAANHNPDVLNAVAYQRAANGNLPGHLTAWSSWDFLQNLIGESSDAINTPEYPEDDALDPVQKKLENMMPKLDPAARQVGKKLHAFIDSKIEAVKKFDNYQSLYDEFEKIAPMRNEIQQELEKVRKLGPVYTN